MSVSTTTDRVTYAGDNSTTAFSFPYVLFANGDLKVYLKNNTTGSETLRTITTHYTISGTLTNGVYESGVTVNFLTAPTSSETVLIYRDRSVTQDLELDENGKIPSLSLEKQLDKLTTDVQRVKNKLARSVALKEGYTASFNPDLPAIMVNEGYVRTKVDGSGLDYISQTDLINTVNTSASDFTPSRAIESDSSGLAVASAVTSVELGYLSGVTSSIQTQINSKQNTITGAASTIVTNDLTASRVVISNVNGKITTTNVTHNEVDRLSGVTDAVSGNNQSATLQNKTLDNTNIITVRDDRFTLQDSADTTKQAAFELSGLTTATTRTLTVPNESGTLITTATVTAKGDLIAATGSSAISRLAAGTNNHALIADSAQATGLKYANIGVAKNILKTTSGTKTPSATNHYHSLTTNSISLTAGTWELTGYANFSNSGSPSYSDIGVAWWGSNGADSSSAPTTALSGVSGITIDSAYGGGTSSYFNVSTQACQIQAPTVIITLTSTQSIFIVTYATMTTAANARITAYMTARQLY